MESSASIWLLMARSLSGEASNEEMDELAKRLSGNENLQRQYDLLCCAWEKDQPAAEHDMQDMEKLKVDRILNKVAAQDQLTAFDKIINRRRWLKKRAIYAFMAVAFASIGLFIIAGNKKTYPLPVTGIPSSTSQPASLVFTAQNGSRSRVMLPDGSTVWLNAGSKIYYVAAFTGPNREVSLEGEAFFDVIKQPKKPFIVHTAGIDIKVLGTAFNVKSYPGDKNIETTLIRGAVEIYRQNKQGKEHIFLKPNEKIVLAKLTGTPSAARTSDTGNASSSLHYDITRIISVAKEEERFETAWVYNRLEFRGDDFEELAVKLERWYNINIIFEDDAVKKLQFNGSFEKETVKQALDALRLVALFNFKIQKNEIFISSCQ